ncbi:hypothetical protein ACMHYB_02815 [Sorangium sp. So ce1128]
MAEQLPAFDPDAPAPPERVAEFEQRLDEALAACEAHLRETGEGPYSTLS